METLKTQRLKHTPGYLSVYCNDGFTLVEQLVSVRAGKSYVQFVQDEIFTPLGMNHSRYPLDYFPEGSFAKRHEGSTPLPQLFINTLASGGLYSTPTDMAKIAMMLIGGGKLGHVRILSKDSVAAMAVDQTLLNFNPVKANAWSYGLGWDTVIQPGLGAVGRWKIYNSKFNMIEAGEGTRSVTLSGGTYYLLFHDTATVNVL